MSVLREDVILSDGPPLGEILERHFPGYGVVAVSVDQYRCEDQEVEPAPRPDGLECHAHVIGSKGHGRRKRLARAAEVIVEPGEDP